MQTVITMPRPSRDEVKAKTRESLLDAAREVFGTVGYQGATLDQIAAKAGFTKGAVYWHFPNKQAVFFAVVTENIDNNLALLDRMIDVDKTDPATIRDFLGKWIDGIDSRENLPVLGVELEVEARNNADFRRVHQELVARHEHALAEFIGRYYTVVGETPPMPVDEIASTIVTILKGFALARQNRPDYKVRSAKVVRLLMNLPPE